MKKIFVIILSICFATMSIMAQDSLGTKTLIKGHFKNPIKSVKYLGFYIAPEYQYAFNNSLFNSGAGFSAMVIFNKRLAFGPSFASSFTDTERIIVGGLKTEYTIKPDALVHFSIPLTIGFGSSSVGGRDFRPNFEGGQFPQEPNFPRPERGQHQDFDNMRLGHGRFMLQPGLNAEMNIIRNIKIYAGATYRFFPVLNIENNDQQTSTITSGVAFQGGLKIGLFDHSVNNIK